MIENPGLATHLGVLESQPNSVENSVRLRLASTDCILQSAVEERIAIANSTKTQQHTAADLEKLKDGAKVDLWREPDSKDDPGWHGSCDLIKNFSSDNKAIATWKGWPMLVPFRHIRPHLVLCGSS